MKNIHDFEPLWGTWYIDTVIGQGSFGTVYKAYCMRDGQQQWCAIKHISIPKNASDLNEIYMDLGSVNERAAMERLTSIRDQLNMEYLMLRQFRGSNNIVDCDDFYWEEKEGEPGYDVFIRMELLECVSNRILDGRIDRDQTIKMGIDICNALTLLRNSNIIHRDVKPQNIFVNANGDYKLGDFGTARSLQGTSAAMSMRGTFAYMSPEAMRGEKTGYTSDIYSLGLVMYRLLNGNKSPFLLPGQASTVTQDDAANMRRMGGEELPMPMNADQELGKIILKACEYDPKDRWQTASDMRNALEGLYHGTVHRKTGTDEDLERARRAAETDQKQKEQKKRDEQQRQEKEKKTNQKKKATTIIAIVAACVALAVAGVFGVSAYTRNASYEAAVALLGEEKWTEAQTAFAQLGDYKDAPEKVEQIANELACQEKYSQAESLMASGDYMGAIVLYQELGSYRDAPEKIRTAQASQTDVEQKAQYDAALGLEAEGMYEEAIAIYTALGEYSNAADKVTTLQERIESYATAQFHENMDEYASAESYYRSAGKYLDAEAKCEEMKNWQLYVEAKGYEEDRNFAKAVEIYKKLALVSFEDAADRQTEAQANIEKESAYQAAAALKAKKLWDEAAAAFAALGSYYDSASQEKSCYYSKAEELYAAGALEDAVAAYGLAGDYSNAAERKAEAEGVIADNALKAQYDAALGLEAEGKYEEAIAIYTALGEYSNAADKITTLQERIESYEAAQLRESMKEYTTAGSYYQAAGNYKDAVQKYEEMKNWQLYQEAYEYEEAGEYAKAFAIYQHLVDNGYTDANERIAQLNDKINKQVSLDERLQALKGYSMNFYVNRNMNAQQNQELFHGMVAAGYQHTLVLRPDGTVFATGSNEYGQCDVSAWENIVAVSAFFETSIGLKADGTVVAAGRNQYGQGDVGNWTEIKAIAAGARHTVGLKTDGTVVAAGDNTEGQLNVGGWQDIVQIAAAGYHTVGLKADGTVVAVGNNDYNRCDVSDWTNVVAIDVGIQHTVGLTGDGRVLIAGRNAHEQQRYHLPLWKNSVALSAGGYHTVGLTADGHVQAIGDNTCQQCDTWVLEEVVAIFAGWKHTVAVKADGTLMALGDNGQGQCNVGGIRLWDLDAEFIAPSIPSPSPTPSPTPRATATPRPTAMPVSVQVYDEVRFGSINWVVLKVDRSGNQALLLSRDLLYNRRFNDKWEDVSWEKSDMRQWLNNQFLNQHFSSGERSAIRATQISSRYGSNTIYTTDRVFLLSTYEFSSLVPSGFRNPASTAGAQNDGVVAGHWLLRDTTNRYNDVNAVINGQLKDYGVNTNALGYGTRPALWVDLSALE